MGSGSLFEPEPSFDPDSLGPGVAPLMTYGEVESVHVGGDGTESEASARVSASAASRSLRRSRAVSSSSSVASVSAASLAAAQSEAARTGRLVSPAAAAALASARVRTRPQSIFGGSEASSKPAKQRRTK